MLVSKEGQKKIETLVQAGQGAQVKALVEQKDVKGLEAKGLSRVDALALLRAAAEKGSSAVFALFDAGKALSTQGDGTAGSQQSALKLVNKVPGKNNATLQRMALVTDVKAERAQKGAIELLTKTLGAQVSSDLSFNLAEAVVRLPPGQLDRAIDRLSSMVGNPAALEAALGEPGWSMQARFAAPKTEKTTWFDTGTPGGTGAVRMRKVGGDKLQFVAKPFSGNPEIRQGIEYSINLRKTPEVDLKDLLANVAQSAAKLSPTLEQERTLVSFSLQHEDGRSTVVDLQSQKLTPRNGGPTRREDTLELSGSKAELTLWPALLKALGVQGEPPAPVAQKAAGFAKAFGLLE